MNIYLAGPWANREEVRVARERLREAHHIVECDWIDLHGAASDDPAQLAREAHTDLEQIYNADAFVSLNIAKSEGKATELGYALANGLILVAVGPEARTNNVFNNLPEVECVDTIEEAITYLNTIAPGRPY